MKDMEALDPPASDELLTRDHYQVLPEPILINTKRPTEIMVTNITSLPFSSLDAVMTFVYTNTPAYALLI